MVSWSGREQPRAFYTVGLRRCPCGRPAVEEIQATGNISYGVFCAPCARRKLKELKRYYGVKDD